jgi:uncharacterized protein
VGRPASHVIADQSEVFAFLAAPRTHGSSEPVTQIDTHGAAVFLAGSSAYKIKRAVRFPFMDFSTLEKRRAACEAEVAVNRPNAPDLYLGVVPIVRSAGGLKLGGAGEVVEWAVHMRRFDENRLLDRVAAAGGLSRRLIGKLASAILASHRKAPRRDGAAATASLERYIEQNQAAFAESPELFPAARVNAVTAAAKQNLAAMKDLLMRRAEEGHVRRCHGDLHLRNLVLLDCEPTLFDAVEFDDAIATGDVLYDLAFLLMDLWERDLRWAANLLLNRYLWESGDGHLPGLAALPLFLSIRAAIRAKVVAAARAHQQASGREQTAVEARRYFAFAERFLEPASAMLVAVGGLSGTGKSTLAAELASLMAPPPGAVHLRSDIERKTAFGVGETEPLPETAYRREVTDEIYARLRRKAALALRAGYGVLVDAVHAGEAERTAIEAVAREIGAPFTGLWLEAPLATLRSRVEQRTGDASDANAAIVERQWTYDLGRVRWARLDASVEPRALFEAALRVCSESAPSKFPHGAQSAE